MPYAALHMLCGCATRRLRMQVLVAERVRLLDGASLWLAMTEDRRTQCDSPESSAGSGAASSLSSLPSSVSALSTPLLLGSRLRRFAGPCVLHVAACGFERMRTSVLLVLSRMTSVASMSAAARIAAHATSSACTASGERSRRRASIVSTLRADMIGSSAGRAVAVAPASCGT